MTSADALQIPPNLVENVARGNCVLFLGADLPREATGLPSRRDLAQGLASRHNLPTTLTLPQVAQRVARGGYVHEVITYLLQQLDLPGRQPARFHQLVARLAAPIVITTAYDDLLTQALAQAGIACNLVVDDSDTTFVDPGRPTLVAFYGTLARKDSLVLTEDEQLGLLRSRDHENVMGLVRAALLQHIVLLLGCDLADPVFQLLWQEVQDRAGKYALGAYVAWPGLPEGERQVWADRRVHVLDVAPLALLEKLAGTAGRAEPPSRPAAPVAETPPAVPPSPPAAAGKYNIHIEHAQGVVIGDQAHVTQYVGGKAAPPAALPPDAQQERLRQLADNIQQDLALLKEYEDTLRLSGDPRERASCRREIERLKASLAEQQRQYNELGG